MDIREQLRNGGFTSNQSDTLIEVFAQIGHTHDIDDVVGLEEALTDEEEDEIIDDDEEEEEEE